MDIFTWVGNLSSVISLGVVLWGLYVWLRENRKITIKATNGGEEVAIATLPARMVTRGEINGLVGQKAKGKRIDLSQFVFDFYKMSNEVEVPLNKADFDNIK